jgi:hypothetical protein
MNKKRYPPQAIEREGRAQELADETTAFLPHPSDTRQPRAAVIDSLSRRQR